jgi:DNA-binding LytR/AlgR family response regulator
VDSNEPNPLSGQIRMQEFSLQGSNQLRNQRSRFIFQSLSDFPEIAGNRIEVKFSRDDAVHRMMPRMNGFEVCRRLKEDPIARAFPIIFLTGMKEESDEARGQVLGAVDYITKPCNPAMIKARVHNHLNVNVFNADQVLARDR